MSLKILLPDRIFTEQPLITHMMVTTNAGAFGILPHRLDCAAAITPGILAYRAVGRGETYIAVDEGVLVKTGAQVMVSVRNAIGGQDLGRFPHWMIRIADASVKATSFTKGREDRFWHRR